MSNLARRIRKTQALGDRDAARVGPPNDGQARSFTQKVEKRRAAEKRARRARRLNRN